MRQLLVVLPMVWCLWWPQEMTVSMHVGIRQQVQQVPSPWVQPGQQMCVQRSRTSARASTFSLQVKQLPLQTLVPTQLVQRGRVLQWHLRTLQALQLFCLQQHQQQLLKPFRGP